jgi:KipI family sensor histidine kinase inhibitor
LSADDASYPRFLPVGDLALSVEFGNVIDPAINAAVIALDVALAAAELPGIVETVPTYRSLLICYEPAEIDHATLVDAVRSLLPSIASASGRRGGRRWLVPVAYGGTFGADLEEAAAALGLSPEQVVELHASVDFLVYLVGFNPGAPNLGGLPPPLHIARRAVPRPKVPASSVAIGGMQSGITSIDSPTGWYVLGRTPVKPYDPRRSPPFLFEAGDRIRFCPIGPDAFARLVRDAAPGDAIAELGD